MSTSNSKPMPSAATDSPLGAPGGNDPYKTVRMPNMAQEGGKNVATSDDMYQTKRAGNTAFFDASSPEATDSDGDIKNQGA